MENFLTKLLIRSGEKSEGQTAPKAAYQIDLDKEYTKHVADSIENDKEPMTKEEFAKSRQGI